MYPISTVRSSTFVTGFYYHDNIYAPNFEEVGGAYCFWDVCACVRPSVTLFITRHTIMVSRWSSVSPSVSPSERTNGHLLGRHILGTLHRVCFIPSINTQLELRFCWVLYLLLGNFALFIYGNLTLASQ